ncbi:MAG: sensor histidine kinase, partial [Flavisolibacter sp.]
ELERKNEEITNFAFVASHDLKEPLRKINTFSDWLLTREKDTLSQSGKEYLKKISTSTKRIDILIRDIVDLTRVHADHSKDELVNLNAIADNLLSCMYDNIKESGAEIEIQELPVIKGNSNQLLTLFRNLVINAIRFQKSGNIPFINIRSEVVQSKEIAGFQNPDHKQYNKISITDNGIGIDKLFWKKIFLIFQRLHGPHEFEGTGMGLAICKKIMENHDGFISVESEPDMGSTFSCYFPL